MRQSDSLALLRHCYIVRNSGLFDSDYYTETSGPVRAKILPPLPILSERYQFATAHRFASFA
jgi:hypothetical protein